VIRGVIFFLLVLPVFFLSSCVEGEEEVWINADASGRMVVHYELPSVAKSQLAIPEDVLRTLKLIDEREQGIEIQSLTFDTSNKVIFHLEATFDNALDLLELAERSEETLVENGIASQSQIAAISGNVAFKIDGLTPSFRRSVSIDGLFPAMVKYRPGMLGPSNFKYTIHLPAKVKETNADTISADGRTLSWTFLLKDHFEQPMEMILSAGLPIPWWAWLALAIIAFGLAWLIWKLVIRRFL
jgi:hypothetical protein